MASKTKGTALEPMTVLSQVTDAEFALIRQIVGPILNNAKLRTWLDEVKRMRNQSRGIDKQMSGRPATNENGTVFLLAAADLWHAKSNELPTGGAIRLSRFEIFACEVARKLDVPMPSLRARRGAIKLWKFGHMRHAEQRKTGCFAWYPL